MERQEENFQGEKLDKLAQNQAHNNPQSSPGIDQRSDRNAYTERDTTSGGMTGKLPGMVNPQQDVKSLSTEPLSAERHAQMLRATQVTRAMPTGQPTTPFTFPRRPSWPEKTPVLGAQPSPVPQLPPEAQSTQALAHQPEQQPLAEASPQKVLPEELVAQQQVALPKTPTVALPKEALLEQSKGQPSLWDSGNMLPPQPASAADKAANGRSGSSGTLQPQPDAQQGWKQWIAKLQAWRLFSPLHAILLFAPIIWTWLSIGLASVAYSQSLERNSELVGIPFLQMWAEGFPGLKKTDFLWGIWHPSLILDVGVTIFLLAVLAFFTWVANYPVKAETNEAQAKEESTLQALDGAVVELRDILAALKAPVAAIESSVAKMGGSYANFESIAGQIKSSFNDLSSAAPVIHKELRKLNDDQMNMMLDARKSSASMQDAAKAMREVAEPFRKEGINKIVQEAVERMEKLDILQQGISQQQINIYNYQQKLQAGVVTQLDVLSQQIKILQQMRASQSQVDITQIILALEQAGYSLQREYAFSVWLRKGRKWLKDKFTV